MVLINWHIYLVLISEVNNYHWHVVHSTQTVAAKKLTHPENVCSVHIQEVQEPFEALAPLHNTPVHGILHLPAIKWQ